MNGEQTNGSQKKDSIYFIASAGFFGAVLPSMAQMVSMLNAKNIPHITFYIGALLMGAMGTGMVLIAKETNSWKALIQGLGLPSFLSSAGTVAVSVALNISPIQPVYAGTNDSVDVTIMNEKGNTLFISQGSSYIKTDSTINVRARVGEDMKIEDKESSVYYNPTASEDTVYLEVHTTEQKAGKDFLRGLLPMMTRQKAPEKTMTVKEIKEKN